ncbi:MAG: hypothetical protein ACI9EF_001540, partial [Pseudohongiellaceae bacterium]
MTKVMISRLKLLVLIAIASLAWPSEQLSANDWPDA